MSLIGGTYSFRDLSGVIATALSGSLLINGQLGIGSISFSNTTEHGVLETAADGVIMPSFVAGDSGVVTIECQQTSLMHKFLLIAFNTLKTASMNGDQSNWASTTASFRATTDGSTHQCLGIVFQKSADKNYKAVGGNVTWTLLVCNLINL